MILEPRPDLVQRAEARICAFDIETTKMPLQFPNAEFDQVRRPSLAKNTANCFASSAVFLVSLLENGALDRSAFTSPPDAFFVDNNIYPGVHDFLHGGP